MSPERILEIVDRVEARIYTELNTTTDKKRRACLYDRLDRAGLLRFYFWLKERGLDQSNIGLQEPKAGDRGSLHRNSGMAIQD